MNEQVSHQMIKRAAIIDRFNHQLSQDALNEPLSHTFFETWRLDGALMENYSSLTWITLMAAHPGLFW